VRAILLLVVLAASLPMGLARQGAAQSTPGCQGAATRSVSYSATSNIVYLRGCGQSFTLSQVAQSVGPAQLELVDAANRIWHLKANLRVEEGATLVVAGAAAGGDANWLRMRSDGAGFVYLRSENGTLRFQNTKVTSWDATTGAVDTAYGTAGRAYVTVRTVVAPGRVTSPSAPCGAGGRDAYEARMDVLDSEMSYLGYNMNEAWGVTWKVYTSDAALKPTETFRRLYEVADIFGDVTGSSLHHNYHGLYTFGGHCMNISGNTAVDNVGYGLDPHDDSDYLVIDSNTVARNGYEGLICAEFCDHLRITNNEVFGNGETGIMLYQATNDSLVEGNRSYGNGIAGIAVLDSHRNTIRNNTVTGNAYSAISLTVGSSDNLIEGNTLTGTTGSGSGYAVYTNGRGSDVPLDGGDGRIRRNVFRGNQIGGSRSSVLKLNEMADGRFEGNTVTGPTGSTAFDLSLGTGNAIAKTTYAGGIATHVQAAGNSTYRGTTTVEDGEVGKAVTVRLDTYSTIELRDTRNLVWRMDGATNGVQAGSVSTRTLTYASAGSSKAVTTLDLAVRPANGTVAVVPTTWSTSSPFAKAWTETSTTTTGRVPHAVGNLQAGQCYEVKVDGTPIGAYVAGGSGTNGKIFFDYAGGYAGGAARSFAVAASSVSPCAPAPTMTATATPSATPTATSTAPATATPTTTPTPGPTLTATATVPPVPVAFADGFETGDLRGWTTVNGITVQGQEVYAGSYAARAATTGSPTFAQRTLSSPQTDLYYRVRFKIASKTTIGYLLRFRTATGSDIVGLNVSSAGKLSVYNRSTATTTASTTVVTNGVWHEVQLHVNQATGLVEVWYDGARVDALSKPQGVGTAQIGRVELGDAAAGGRSTSRSTTSSSPRRSSRRPSSRSRPRPRRPRGRRPPPRPGRRRPRRPARRGPQRARRSRWRRAPRGRRRAPQLRWRLAPPSRWRPTHRRPPPTTSPSPWSTACP
jgi:parallel beta-helix repeat protein